MNITPNQFTAFALTREEELEGSSFSSAQEAVLQNQLAKIAEQLINLTIDMQMTNDFVAQHAYLKGQLDILQHLLSTSQSTQG